MTDTEYHTIPVGNFVHVVGTMWEVAFGGIRAFQKPSTDTTHYKNGADRIVLQEPIRGNGFFKTPPDGNSKMLIRLEKPPSTA